MGYCEYVSPFVLVRLADLKIWAFDPPTPLSDAGPLPRSAFGLKEVWSGSNPGVLRYLLRQRRRRRGQKTEIVLSAVTCRDITPWLLSTAGM